MLPPAELAQQRSKDTVRVAQLLLGDKDKYTSEEIVSDEDPQMSTSFQVEIEKEGDEYGFRSIHSSPAKGQESANKWTSEHLLVLNQGGTVMYYENSENGETAFVFDPEEEPQTNPLADQDHPASTRLNALMGNLLTVAERKQWTGQEMVELKQIQKREEDRIQMENQGPPVVYFGSEDSPTTLN